MFESADSNEIDAFGEVLHQVDCTLEKSKTSKSVLSKKPKLKELFDHCCQTRHYSFCVKKCGSDHCRICKPLRMDPDLFRGLHFPQFL